MKKSVVTEFEESIPVRLSGVEACPRRTRFDGVYPELVSAGGGCASGAEGLTVT